MGLGPRLLPISLNRANHTKMLHAEDAKVPRTSGKWWTFLNAYLLRAKAQILWTPTTNVGECVATIVVPWQIGWDENGNDSYAFEVRANGFTGLVGSLYPV